MKTSFAWPWLLGAALRLHQLPAQVLVDDEWHMVHRLRNDASLASLVTDFGAHDHSIGLSVCSWLMLRVTTVDELLLRMPSLAAGLLLIVVIPVWMARVVGREIAIVLAWALAVAPLLCFFSRLARPYAITTLLVGVAVMSFHRWFVTSGADRAARRWFVLSATLTPVFHLAALPAVLATFTLPLVARLAPPAAAASPRQVRRLLFATLAVMSVLLAVPLASGSATLLAKARADHLPLASVLHTLELLTGTGHVLAVVVLGALTLGGMVVLGRRARLLTLYLLVVAGLQVLAVVASGPLALHVPIVAARYLVVLLPLLLVFPAAALVLMLRVRGDRNAGLVGALLAAALVAVGPLAWIYETPNHFTNHISYQADYVPGRYFERFRPYAIPEFYRHTLAARAPASVTIVEAPWFYYFHSLAYLQRIHRQRVLIGFVDDETAGVRDGELAAAEPGIRLRQAVRLDDRDALRRRHVDFVILHRDVPAEVRWPTGVRATPVDVTRWEARYRAWFGTPVFDADGIVVFAVS